MNIIHIMKDGSIRDSMTGIVIHNEDFYAVLNAINEQRLEKKKGDKK